MLYQGAKRRSTNNGIHVYGITISKHQKTDYVDKSELNAVISTLKMRLETLHITAYSYENSGKYGQLHFHGTCYTRKPVYFKQNNTLLGFRIEWRKLKTADQQSGWHKYITKEVSNEYEQEQILINNYYKHNYAFTI